MWFSSSFSMKLVDFARWSDKGMPTPLNITLTCAAPEVCVCVCFSLSQLQHLAHTHMGVASVLSVNMHSFACKCACLLKRALRIGCPCCNELGCMYQIMSQMAVLCCVPTH